MNSQNSSGPPQQAGLCPKCHQALQSSKNVKLGLITDLCSVCQGFWIDHSDLKRLPLLHFNLGFLDKANLCEVSEVTAEQGVCPHCTAKLTSAKTTAKSIVFEFCQTCKGIWLDSGELQKIQTP